MSTDQQPDIIHYTNCPACHSTAIGYAITATDFTVTRKLFEIWECRDCTLRFTQHVPGVDSIGAYYASQDYVSHTDTQQGLVNKLYHTVRNHTLHTKRDLVKKYSGLQSGALLEVGAGTGAFANTMQQAGWMITGLEPDATARSLAAAKYGLTLLPPGELYQLPSASYDVITLWHVLEHVHDLHGYLENFHRLLKPAGKLVVAVPNYTSRDATVYQSAWAAYDVPRHLYHFSPAAMKKLAASKGFSVNALRPMWFDSFYVAMLSEKYRNGNLLSAAWNGLASNINTLSRTDECSSVIYVMGK